MLVLVMASVLLMLAPVLLVLVLGHVCVVVRLSALVLPSVLMISCFLLCIGGAS